MAGGPTLSLLLRRGVRAQFPTGYIPRTCHSLPRICILRAPATKNPHLFFPNRAPAKSSVWINAQLRAALYGWRLSHSSCARYTAREEIRSFQVLEGLSGSLRPLRSGTLRRIRTFTPPKFEL